MGLTSFQRTHVAMKIPKKEFAALVGTVWTETTEEIVQRGFAKGGVFPFNKQIIPRDKFDPQALKRYDHQLKSLTPKEPLASTSRQSQTPTSLVSMNTEKSDQAIIDLPEVNTSFEELLLQTVKQTPIPQKTKKRRVAKGAEVVTQKQTEEKDVAHENNPETREGGSKKKLKLLRSKENSKNVTEKIKNQEKGEKHQMMIQIRLYVMKFQAVMMTLLAYMTS